MRAKIITDESFAPCEKRVFSLSQYAFKSEIIIDRPTRNLLFIKMSLRGPHFYFGLVR